LQQASRKTLILGVGNPLSGDDIFGSQVLQRLHQNKKNLPPGITLVDAHTDLLNHIEDFAEYENVLLIDAILDPEGKLAEPGNVVALDEEKFKSFSEVSQSVHQISPLMALKLFRVLHPQAQTKIILIGLIIDRLASKPRYATSDRAAVAAALIKRIL
jgi:hydrogenase maturation protease